MQQTKDKEKVRVFALARGLGVDSKTIIDLCKSMGFEVKSQLASLEHEQVDALKQRLARGPKAAGPEAPRPAPAAAPPRDKRIVNLIGKSKVETRPDLDIPPPEVEPVAQVPVAATAPVEDAPTVEPEPEIVPEAPIVAETPEVVAPEVEPIAPVVNEVIPEPTPVVIEPEIPAARTAVPTEAPKAVPAPVMTTPVTPQPIVKGPPTITTSKIVNLSQRSRSPANLTPARPNLPPPPPVVKVAPVPPTTAKTSSGPGGGAPVTPPPVRDVRPAGGPTGAGGPGRDGGRRVQRTEADRKLTSQHGGKAPGVADKDKKPAPAGPTKFTAEQLQALREGRSVTDVLKKAPPPPVPGVPPAPGVKVDEQGDEVDEDGKKKTGPGKVAGRDSRHADRAKRQEQRKVRQSSVVIQGGQVDIEEENFGTKRGKRPKALLKKKLPGTVERKGKVPITLPITVRSLSEAIGMKVAELVFKLKDLTASLYTINSSIDRDVAELIASEKGVEFEIIKAKDAEEDLFEEHKQAGEDESQYEPRAPVVTIMGHVDHGKTSLLDRIRSSNVVDTEAGGITQVIRAWRVMHKGKPITFLDTPGHEAFTKMRARGANVTDIVVIVVAANDGVMPQTEEAINHAKAAGVSMVVAINKIDLPDANLRRTEQQLYGFGLIPDSMGGDCQFVQTSATKGIGIDDLLETLTLVAELKELKANPHKPALGTCLEAHLSGDEGVMATVLVQQGTLHRGDVIICGASYGRVRAMYDDHGLLLEEAGPSLPVRITGLDDVPNADDHFHVVADLAKAREIADKRKTRAQEAQFKPRDAIKLESLGDAKNKIQELKVILKAEARGSVEAIRKELEKLVHDEVRVRLLHAGIGAITESDVQLALASPEDTIVVGFNVVPDDMAMRLAEDRDISIREYNIIYKLTEDIKAALEGKLKPREEIIHLGRAVIRETFRVSRTGTIAGCYITQGTIERSSKIRVIREGAVVYPPPEKTATLDSLKRFKDDVREVREGYDCGMKISGYDDLKVGDVIEAYRIEHVLRTL